MEDLYRQQYSLHYTLNPAASNPGAPIVSPGCGGAWAVYGTSPAPGIVLLVKHPNESQANL